MSIAGIMGDSYRTGVVNDFSIVSKAVFTIIKFDPFADMEKYKKVDILPVQINPNKFSYDASTNLHRIHGHKGDQVNTVYSTSERSTNIELIYDIYDEYMIGTSEGCSLKHLMGGSLSLFDEEVTSLPKLMNYASQYSKEDKSTPYYYAYFVWGDIEYFGILSGVSCTYTAFSRWGEPLKCDATVTIELEEKPSLVNFGKIYGQVQKYLTPSKVANAAALAVTQAMR